MPDYNFGNIRKLLKEALTENQLEELIFDNFGDVRGQLSKALTDRIIELIDYVKKQRKIEVLLEAVKQANSTVYQEFADKLTEPEVVSLSNLKELSSDCRLIDRLAEILPKDDEKFWQITKRVYKDFLLDVDSEYELEEIFDLDDLLWQLRERTEDLIVSEFVARLIAYILVQYPQEYKEVSGGLRQTISNLKVDGSAFGKSLRRFKKEYQESSNCAYLMISIKEIYSRNSFEILGWFTNDRHDRHLSPLNVQNLETDANEQQVLTLEDLKEITRNLLEQAAQKLPRERCEKLIIEFFLSSSLISTMEIEKWEIDTDGICLGSVHEFRIRSLDRQKPKYNTYIGKWKSKWNVVAKCKKPLPYFLSSHSDCDANTLTGQLQNAEKVGLKLNSVLKSGHERIVSALYYSGTPIALWFKGDPDDGDCEAQLNLLLQEELLKLPDRVFTARCECRHDLSLIWDDPNRLIPNYQLQ